MAKKYVSLSKLSIFLENLKNTFATLGHKHNISDITDYKIDTSLSSTSTNPVQNKVLNAEFDAISEAMDVLELSIDDKANTTHIHTIANVTNLQSTLDEKVPTSRTVNGKALSSNISLSASDVGADVSGSANSALSSAKTYTDSVVAHKTQVQIITWGEND
jgi:hypothetical protein